MSKEMNYTKKDHRHNGDLSFVLDDSYPRDRLYGRKRGHALSQRQLQLMEEFLPKIQFPSSGINNPIEAFGKKPKELWLEIGFGSGEHSLKRHKDNPDIGYIACEVFENGICTLLSNLLSEYNKSQDDIPSMIRLWTQDARILLKSLPDQSINKLFLLFPDPWPKIRHSKRRFVHQERLPIIHQLLCPSGKWYIASDDPTYQNWVREVMGQQIFFEKILETSERPKDWPPTRYEQKAYRENRTPIFWIFQKISN